MNRLLLSAALSLTFVAGCDSIDWVEILNEIQRPPPAPVPPAPPPPPAVARDPRCDGGFGGKVDVDSIAAARRALVGRWILCSARGLTHLPQDGLEIGQDDRFVTLIRGRDGRLTRDEKADRQGTVIYRNTSMNDPSDPAVQIEFRTDLAGSVHSLPYVSIEPRALLIRHMGVFEYIYVAER